MGRYLEPGHEYVDGQTVSGPSLTEHVADAVLKSTAISDQVLKDPAAPTDELLINDGGTLKKVTLQIVQTLIRSGFTTIPVGALMDFSGADAPEGWFLCYGQEVSRETYADLFAVIGTTYGAGNGSSSFNIPDLRGRVAAGKDDMGGTNASRIGDPALNVGLVGTTLGSVGGQYYHALTTAELAYHVHAASTSTSSAAAIYTVENEAGGNVWNLVRTGSTVPAGGLGFGQRAMINAGGYVTGVLSTSTTSIGGTGSNGAHNNVQPTMMTNKIIKY